MALVPYTITALAESDAQGTDGKNIVAGATCSMYSQPSDSVVTLYDDAAGSNGSTSKVTGANGQVVVYVEPGSYRVSVNAVDSFVAVALPTTQSEAVTNTEELLESLTRINEAGIGGELRLSEGDYLISSQLTISSNLTIKGAGMPSYRGYWLDLVNVSDDGGYIKFTVSDPDSRITHKIMPGDVVKVQGASTGSGTQEVKSINTSESSITISTPHQDGITFDTGASLRVSILNGGSIIRFQNPETGSSTTGLRFFDESDIRNFNLRDIGFVGPGVNEVFGGGMRFRRQNGPDGVSRAITGYDWNNVLITHAAMDAIRFDQLIHSKISHLAINRCVGDALLFKAGAEGGTTTSVHIDSPYIQNCRRGIAFYTAAYCTITNPVVEGTSLGYYINRGIGMTLNSIASETIKFDSSGQSGGTTGLFVNCYGMVINGVTAYYNTEESAWSKATLVFTDPGKRTESPVGVINGGHIHWSLGQKIPVIATRWDASRIGRIYVDVSNDDGYSPPEGATGSNWIGNSFWDDSILIEMTGITRDPIFNQRYSVSGMNKTTYIPSGANSTNVPPGVNDDSNAGYTAFDSYWLNTTEGERSGRYVCIDDTIGAARWVKTEETFEIEFTGRDSNPLSKEAEPDGAEAYVFRLGRNYGVDVATDNIQRVMATGTEANGDFNCWLDITHLHPVRFLMTVNYNPYTGTSTSQYTVKAVNNVNEGGTDYIEIELIVGDDGDGSAHDDLFVDALNGDGDPIEVRYSDNGPTTVTIPSKMRLDSATQNMFLYFLPTDYIQAGDMFSVYNCKLPEMDGRWTVDTPVLSTQQGLPCVKVTCSDRALRTSIIEEVDYGVYVADKWGAPVSSQLTMDGLDVLYTFDEAESICIPDSRQGSATAINGTTATTVNVSAANNFEFHGYFNNQDGRVWVASQTYTSVTFGHAAPVGDQKFTWLARRKKSPTVQAIYDRN